MSLWRKAATARAHSLESRVIKEEVGHRSQLCCGVSALTAVVAAAGASCLRSPYRHFLTSLWPSSRPALLLLLLLIHHRGYEDAFQNSPNRLELVTLNQPICAVILVLSGLCNSYYIQFH